MALFKFTKGILAGEPIPVYNYGKMVRDFTYVGDVVEAVIQVMACPPAPGDDPETDAPFRLFNVGNSSPVELIDYIRMLEECLGRKAQLDLMPMQVGDIAATMADSSRLEQVTGFRPNTPVADGIRRFVDWYREYYKA